MPRMFGRKSDEAVRREAHRWSMRMHGDDAAKHHDAFERWRAADPRHSVAYVRLEQQWNQAALLAQTRVGRARTLPHLEPMPVTRRISYAAAFAVLVLAIGLGLWMQAPDVLGNHPQAATELATRIGEIRTLDLPDGSRVTLDTDSAVRLAFSPEARRVALVRGRARFDVAHNADRPFIVHAGTGTVVARGTVFDVSLLDGRVGVTLLRGIVDVRETGRDERHAPRHSVVRLHPGQHTEFTATEPPAPPQAAPPAEGGWVSGMLSFDADRLGDALAQANRYSAAKISVADPTLEDLKITGAYHVRDAAAFAEALAVSLHLKASVQPNGDIILSRPARI